MAFFHPNFMLQAPHQDEHTHPSTSLPPLLPSCSTPQEFHGVAPLLGKRSSMGFSTGIDVCEEMNNHGEDELSDDGSQVGEKKRRLNMEQVKTLEKNFELGGPDGRLSNWRKIMTFSREQFEAVKAENDALQTQNQKLHAEIMALKNKEPTESINLNKETEGSCSNRSENSSEIKLDISRTPAIDSPLPAHPTNAGRPSSHLH
ncbi:UNVERIFIED_CONTAM: Homeobox-leucine zipper protein ATHB-13 [Sesamum radiatum]|uniref:Homeobox-leucine zipper protein n=1 Tax=Sesamum radiatum TaxID=300843 RepID=A0AAW2TVT1_SESRA